MLTNLRIQGFKAWKDTGRLRLAPLTVFFGANSAGKSSLTQLLLALKQTVESPDRQRVLHPGDSKTVVELGTFADMAYAHQSDSPIRFEFAWRLPKPLHIKDSRSDYVGSFQAIEFEAEISQLDSRVQVDKFRYRLSDEATANLTVDYGRRENGKGNKFELIATPYQLVRTPGRVWQLPPPIKFYGFPDEAVAYFQNSGFIADLALEVERIFGRLYYLGPLRQFPARGYMWSGEIPAHAGWHGERAIEAILAAKGRLISPGYKRKAHPFEAVIARWLLEMGLVHGFSVKAIAKHRKEFEVTVKTSPQGSEVNLPDVGFGVSQILPVVVQCFYAPPHSTVILEQPEIHLHPEVQKSLADLFIEAIHAREDGDDRAVQLIVESHSEHFLHRLLRRVAEKKITPKEIAIYFCTPGQDGSHIEELQVDLYGNVVNWPQNFFGDEMDDIASRVDVAIKRKVEGKAEEAI